VKKKEREKRSDPCGTNYDFLFEHSLESSCSYAVRILRLLILALTSHAAPSPA
jgi:hypothetical protein